MKRIDENHPHYLSLKWDVRQYVERERCDINNNNNTNPNELLPESIDGFKLSECIIRCRARKTEPTNKWASKPIFGQSAQLKLVFAYFHMAFGCTSNRVKWKRKMSRHLQRQSYEMLISRKVIVCQHFPAKIFHKLNRLQSVKATQTIQPKR